MIKKIYIILFIFLFLFSFCSFADSYKYVQFKNAPFNLFDDKYKSVIGDVNPSRPYRGIVISSIPIISSISGNIDYKSYHHSYYLIESSKPVILTSLQPTSQAYGNTPTYHYKGYYFASSENVKIIKFTHKGTFNALSASYDKEGFNSEFVSAVVIPYNACNPYVPHINGGFSSRISFQNGTLEFRGFDHELDRDFFLDPSIPIHGSINLVVMFLVVVLASLIGLEVFLKVFRKYLRI